MTVIMFEGDRVEIREDLALEVSQKVKMSLSVLASRRVNMTARSKPN